MVVQRPQIEMMPVSETRARFVIEPLEPGFGYTLGNTLRRTLLSRIPGAAVSSIRMDGIYHEFTTVPGVKEDVVDIILNVKRLVVRMTDLEPLTLRLSATGPGPVTAADLEAPTGVEVVSQDLHLATLEDGVSLEVEMVVEQGVGYRSAVTDRSDPIGTIPIDAIFSPVRNVSYRVENTQVGQMTNFDRLEVDIETDGSMEPSEALSSAGKTLRELLSLFADVGEGIGLELGDVAVVETVSQDLDLPIEALDLSERPRNCLRRAQISTVGELTKQTREDLLDMTNFGQKSLEEVIAKLDELGLGISPSRDRNG
ncbi:DNA-directed RNA polymerase subunit alpha [Candidatus Spongiisocius sp.]|uniref:DNA-directed RNA polymerase subunit alpha n=1 Tax=Candidatus Spongiisocius sp. TaxID=3101273 RepID=UPI003B5A5B28